MSLTRHELDRCIFMQLHDRRYLLTGQQKLSSCTAHLTVTVVCDSKVHALPVHAETHLRLSQAMATEYLPPVADRLDHLAD